MEYTQVVGKHVKVKIIAKLREQRKFFFFVNTIEHIHTKPKLERANKSISRIYSLYSHEIFV